MISRPVTLDDIETIRKLHEKNYPELEFPDFTKMLSSFIIEDNNDIIMTGGVKLISEALLITNKDMSRIKIGKALVIAQGACIHIAKKFNINNVYAFSDNNDYIRHLIKHGFEERYDRTLVMRL